MREVSYHRTGVNLLRTSTGDTTPFRMWKRNKAGYPLFFADFFFITTVRNHLRNLPRAETRRQDESELICTAPFFCLERTENPQTW